MVFKNYLLLYARALDECSLKIDCIWTFQLWCLWVTKNIGTLFLGKKNTTGFETCLCLYSAHLGENIEHSPVLRSFLFYKTHFNCSNECAISNTYMKKFAHRERLWVAFVPFYGFHWILSREKFNKINISDKNSKSIFWFFFFTISQCEMIRVTL